MRRGVLKYNSLMAPLGDPNNSLRRSTTRRITSEDAVEIEMMDKTGPFNGNSPPPAQLHLIKSNWG